MKEENPLYRDCEWLAAKTENRINNICSNKTESHGNFGPAREVCKALCDTCTYTLSPASSPVNEPSSEPPNTNPTTREPTTTAPTVKLTHTPTKAQLTHCCSHDFKTCANSGSWCHENRKHCEQCNGMLIFNAPLKCIERWGECTNNLNGCCAPATCRGNRHYRQCLS